MTDFQMPLPIDYGDPKKEKTRRQTIYDRLPSPRKYYATLDELVGDLDTLAAKRMAGIVRFRDEARAGSYANHMREWLDNSKYHEKGAQTYRLGRRCVVSFV